MSVSQVLFHLCSFFKYPSFEGCQQSVCALAFSNLKMSGLGSKVVAEPGQQDGGKTIGDSTCLNVCDGQAETHREILISAHLAR